MLPGALRSERLAAFGCLAVGAASALPAIYDAWKVVTLVLAQMHGPAEGTDFLNLYAGARLFSTDPSNTYELDVQHALQRSLTERDSFLVPFYLPPYAALLVSWLGWLPFPWAFLIWLVIGIGCVLAAAYWMAPRWTRLYPLVWFGLAMLFLPCLLGLAQGQTSGLMLLCASAFASGLLKRRKSASVRLGLGLIGLALKPQFAPDFACALVAARRWRALGIAAALIGLLTLAAVLRLGPAERLAYTQLSRQKLMETLTADPTFLIGPTLLHASHWFLGVSLIADAIAAVVAIAILLVAAYIWRQGLLGDDAILLQLAVLPVVSILVAPYALVYELTIWLVSFWLLWRYTETRPAARAVLLWLTAAVWVAGNVGVALPLAGGADVAALLGVAAVAFIAWLHRTHPGATTAAVAERDAVGV